MIPFGYHPEILKHFPKLAGGALLGSGMQNRPTPEGLLHLYQEEQQHVLARIGNAPLSEIEALAAWRSAFRLFGVDPTQYRSAAEALLRRLTKKGDIPSINAVVDICNLVSIRYALPVAAFDLRPLHGTVTVQFATGSERFTPLGEATAEHPEPGEVIFADQAGLVVARRWCWRQSEESAAQVETREALFTIEAQHEGGKAIVEGALKDLQNLLVKFVGGEYWKTMLSQEQQGGIVP
jgi:DNA/RNA-binding domain of Phe-tRNA-synthetase-like protein